MRAEHRILRAAREVLSAPATGAVPGCAERRRCDRRFNRTLADKPDA